MMECKKALSAEGNDYDKAAEWLRKNGTTKAASKLVGRSASEGLIGISFDAECGKASIVKISSETDFASRSTDFQHLVDVVADHALLESNVDKLKDAVKDDLDKAILAIRENLQISSVEVMTASSDDSVLVGYVHGKVSNDRNAGTAAALVELRSRAKESDLSEEDIQSFGKRLSMHIVAAKPSYRSVEDVPNHEMEKERDFLMDQMADSGKPTEIKEKIVGGRMRKYFESICLVEQSHMLEDGNPKVSKALDDMGLELVSFKSSYVAS